MKSMKSPSKAKGLWLERANDTVHKIIMANMGLFNGVFGRLIFFTDKFSMIRKMAASMMPAWIMVVAHGWTDPLARGVKIIRVHIM